MDLQRTAPPRLWREVLGALIPEDLANALLTTEQRLQESSIGRKIAVFDLDNTLLLGDIGEAVFAALQLRGHAHHFTWNSYRRQLNSDRAAAYCSLVKATEGLTEHLVQSVTLDVLTQDEEYIELDHSYVRVPQPHPVMASVVQHLRATGFQIYVISASNQLSARIAAWRFFNIPPFCVFGIRQTTQGRTLTDKLIGPIPIGAGKVEVYRQFAGDVDPVITAGDSMLDMAMLSMTDPRGFVIWVGEDTQSLDVARNQIGRDREVHFVRRPLPS